MEIRIVPIRNGFLAYHGPNMPLYLEDKEAVIRAIKTLLNMTQQNYEQEAPADRG